MFVIYIKCRDSIEGYVTEFENKEVSLTTDKINDAILVFPTKRAALNKAKSIAATRYDIVTEYVIEEIK